MSAKNSIKIWNLSFEEAGHVVGGCTCVCIETSTQKKKTLPGDMSYESCASACEDVSPGKWEMLVCRESRFHICVIS